MSRVLLLGSFLLATVLAADERVVLYSSKYDGIDADAILRNPRQRNNYLNCYLSKQACSTPDMRFFRDVFPEALVTRCKRCTEKQKELFEKVTDWYTRNDPETWDKVVAKTIEEIQRKSQ